MASHGRMVVLSVETVFVRCVVGRSALGCASLFGEVSEARRARSETRSPVCGFSAVGADARGLVGAYGSTVDSPFADCGRQAGGVGLG